MLPEEILVYKLLVTFPAEDGISHPIVDLGAMMIAGKIDRFY